MQTFQVRPTGDAAATKNALAKTDGLGEIAAVPPA